MEGELEKGVMIFMGGHEMTYDGRWRDWWGVDRLPPAQEPGLAGMGDGGEMG